MDSNALFKISYGLFVLSANDGKKDNACIINTLQQVTSDPLMVTIAVNKSNYTHDIIEKTGLFTTSIISEAANFELFKRFGFQSGKLTDKFEGFPHYLRTVNKTLAITEGTNAYISSEVVKKLDLGSHTLFVAKVEEAKIISDVPSATYEYYHANIKPKANSKPKTGKKVWRCKICGYEYEGEDMPEDFVCPICKHGKMDFEVIS